MITQGMQFKGANAKKASEIREPDKNPTILTRICNNPKPKNTNINAESLFAFAAGISAGIRIGGKGHMARGKRYDKFHRGNVENPS